MRIRLSLLVILSLLFLSPPVQSQEWRVVWGDLHTHTDLGDGTGSPTQAYQYALKTCDFLALTEHNHMIDEEELRSMVEASKASYDGFTPLFGQEFSTIKGGNHLNVFNITECIPGAMNSNYKKLYTEWLPDYQVRHPNAIVFCQFNHPDSVEKDYGISKAGNAKNYEGDWDAFVEDANKWVRLIAVVNGPGSHTKGQHNIHADISEDVKAWFAYLDRGMRLSPTANHDTHVDSWGDLTNARTGVWIKGAPNGETILTALKEGRCFATEDKNLSAWFTINGQPMGSQLADMGSAGLTLKVAIKDEDEPRSTYKVEVFQNKVNDGDTAKKICEGEVACGQTYIATVPHANGSHEFYLVHVLQNDESDDVDDLWTAPIYIGPGSVEKDEVATESTVKSDYKFVGSKQSDVYHFPTCKSVKMIKPENLVHYPEAPKDKKLHNGCPVE